jgi:hypothetical protein
LWWWVVVEEEASSLISPVKLPPCIKKVQKSLDPLCTLQIPSPQKSCPSFRNLNVRKGWHETRPGIIYSRQPKNLACRCFRATGGRIKQGLLGNSGAAIGRTSPCSAAWYCTSREGIHGRRQRSSCLMSILFLKSEGGSCMCANCTKPHW